MNNFFSNWLDKLKNTEQWINFFNWMDTLEKYEQMAVWVFGIPGTIWAFYMFYAIFFVVLGSPLYRWYSLQKAKNIDMGKHG